LKRVHQNRLLQFTFEFGLNGIEEEQTECRDKSTQLLVGAELS
jgi:hypothetical protein